MFRVVIKGTRAQHSWCSGRAGNKMAGWEYWVDKELSKDTIFQV
jgi:hypothetical protein